MCVISLTSGENTLRLHIHGRVCPGSRDYWDANWLNCTAEASVGSLCGRIESQLRNEDLLRFMRGLESLGGRVGEALLDTGNGWLDLRIIRDERAQIHAICQLEDISSEGSNLEFNLSLDRICISNLIAQLRQALKLFPVLSPPNDLKTKNGGDEM